MHVIEHPKFRLVEGDIRDGGVLQNVFADPHRRDQPFPEGGRSGCGSAQNHEKISSISGRALPPLSPYHLELEASARTFAWWNHCRG